MPTDPPAPNPDPTSLDIAPFQKGQILDAARLERMRQVQAGQSITVEGGGGVAHNSGGTSIRQPVPQEFWARITAGTNPYGWIRVIPITAGGWQDAVVTGSAGGSGAAREVNGNAGVPASTIVWMRRDGGLDQFHFQYSACPS